MKTIIFLLFLSVSLMAQTGYQWERYKITSTGGFLQSNNYYIISSIGLQNQGYQQNSQKNSLSGFIFLNFDNRYPKITSISDIPADQGHNVQIVWNKCGFDNYNYSQDNFYTLWRLDNTFSKQFNQLSKTKNNQKQIIIKSLKEYQKVKNQKGNIFFKKNDKTVWAFITQIPAMNYENYSYVAQTLVDSSSSGDFYTVFKVVYHNQFTYYESQPDSGYSIDNIPPDKAYPKINKTNSNMVLHWNKVEYGTYNGNKYKELNGIWYKIYSSNQPYFSCNNTHYLTTITDTTYTIQTNSNKKFYKIIVSDNP